MELKFEYTLESLNDVLPQIWNSIKDKKVVVLEGDLGAGKTTFLIYLFKYLSVEGDVSSPTFSIINEYEWTEQSIIIYHFDLYRISDIAELYDLGFEEICEQKNAKLFVEWPQIAKELLPDDTVLLHINHLDANSRAMCIKLYFDL